jgi:DUF1009 family protein
MGWVKKDSSEERIGLLAGQGELPVQFAKAAASLNRRVVVIGLEGITDRRVEAFAGESHYLKLGALEPLVDLLKTRRIRNVVFAGGLPKKEIYNPSLKLDTGAQKVLASTPNKGDDHLLRAFQWFLRTRCGARVMDPKFLLKELLASKGVMTRREPTPAEWQDLRFGFRAAKHIGKSDVGQTVVVKNGVVVAVEAIEGTDAAIRRGGDLGNGAVVVVKVAKPRQNLKFDLPCVGPGTLEALQSVSSTVLGIESDKTLMFFKDQMLQKANQERMTVVGLSSW